MIHQRTASGAVADRISIAVGVYPSRADAEGALAAEKRFTDGCLRYSQLVDPTRRVRFAVIVTRETPDRVDYRTTAEGFTEQTFVSVAVARNTLVAASRITVTAPHEGAVSEGAAADLTAQAVTAIRAR